MEKRIVEAVLQKELWDEVNAKYFTLSFTGSNLEEASREFSTWNFWSCVVGLFPAF